MLCESYFDHGIDPFFLSAEDITVSTARKGIPQAAWNQMEIVWENDFGNR